MFASVYDHFFIRFAGLFWRFRHLWDRNWTQGYTSKEALEHPHRKMILEAVARCEPFDTLLEYGCGPGANLSLLAEKYPEAAFVGLDISEVALREAIKRPNILYRKEWPSGFDFDIFLTDASLIYCRNIQFTSRAIRRHCNAYIGCEWHSDNGPFIDEGHWVHNYRKLFPGCKITKIPKEVWPGGGWEKYGSIVEWKR